MKNKHAVALGRAGGKAGGRTLLRHEKLPRETRMSTPTKKHARKIMDLLRHGLTQGLGKPEPGKLCVEAAVNYAFGLPHGDNPPCVGFAIRRFKISLNDCGWSSNHARADGLRRLAIAQLGSNEIDQLEFVKRLALAVIREGLPPMLRKIGLEDKAKACEEAETLDAASDAASYASAVSDAARDAASCASAVSYAASSASDAARDAASCASAVSYAASSASYATSDRVLAQFAEIAVKVLISLKCKGCRWLDLTERAA